MERGRLRPSRGHLTRALAHVRHDDEQGASAVEYGLLVALIAVAIIGAVTALGGNINAVFQAIIDALPG